MAIKTFNTIPALDDDSILRINKRELDPPSFDENLEQITIFDIDEAVFDLFDKKINFHIDSEGQLKKVPIIFATGERWALNQQNKPFRDEHGVLVLPLASIRRLDIDRTESENLPAGSPALDRIVFKVKRSKINSDYQNLRNIAGLANQQNIGKAYGLAKESGANKTSRRASATAFAGTIFHGKILQNDNRPQIVDIYTIPYPDFFRVNYEITFWTQYQTQMNTILHRLFNEFENMSLDTIQITTKAGYIIVAYFEQIVSNEGNLEDFTDNERVIKHTITFSIPAYAIQTQLTEEHLIHKTTSSPEISFSVIAINELTTLEEQQQGNPLGGSLLEDIEDLTTVKQERPRQRRQDKKAITAKKLKKNRVAESSAFFPNLDELERFFR